MLEVRVDAAHKVSAIAQRSPQAIACLVLAHGAGAGMTHASMAALADGLAARQAATLRFQFPFMEEGGKRPDRPALAQATVRAACEAAAQAMPGLPLIAGGRSFGGRMTSQAQAADPLPDVRGLVFFGFPLHPPKQVSAARAEHLAAIRIPMLFLQGTRDTLADIDLMRATVERLGARATLRIVDGGDHSFHVLKRSGRTDADAMAAMLDDARSWVGDLIGRGG